MTLHFHWYLPTNGDGREVTGALEPREASGRAPEMSSPVAISCR